MAGLAPFAIQPLWCLSVRILRDCHNDHTTWFERDLYFLLLSIPGLGSTYDHTKGRTTCFKTRTNRLTMYIWTIRGGGGVACIISSRRQSCWSLMSVMLILDRTVRDLLSTSCWEHECRSQTPKCLYEVFSVGSTKTKHLRCKLILNPRSC